MIFDKLNLAVGAVVGAIVASGLYSLANTVYFFPQQRAEGKQAYIAEQLAKDIAAERERKKLDAELQNLSDYDLCVRALVRDGQLSVCDAFKLQPLRAQ